MTTLDYVLDSALVLMVFLQIREQPITWRTFLGPLVVIGIACGHYLKSVPTSGNDVVLTLTLAALGAAIGFASGVTLKMRRDSARQVLIQARWASVVFWVLGMGGRFAFLIWISHGGVAWLTQFSIHHHITSSAAWTVAVLAEAVLEVLARMLVVGARAVHQRSVAEWT